ncbi:hypothetical protein LOZ66_005255 [Ophidiomyces ophidiicola]|nr:hypothetical protein LOZ66_005255 [Ophidiomyces ophidiicola]
MADPTPNDPVLNTGKPDQVTPATTSTSTKPAGEAQTIAPQHSQTVENVSAFIESAGEAHTVVPRHSQITEDMNISTALTKATQKSKEANKDLDNAMLKLDDDGVSGLIQDAILQCLDDGADIHRIYEVTGEPLLNLASRKGCLKVVERLLTKEIDPNVKDNDGWTPIYSAVCAENVEILKKLASRGGNIEISTPLNGWTPLHLAVWYRATDIVKELLLLKAQLGPCDRDGDTPLHLAAMRNAANIVELLLNNRAKVDICNNSGSTPLHLAAEYGHKETVELLLSNGANIDICDNDEEVPLHIGARKGYEKIVKLLLDKNAKVGICNSHQSTPLHLAVQNGYMEIVELLFKSTDESGTVINQEDSDEQTPLILASQYSTVEMVEVILKYKPDLKHRSKGGRSPLHAALANRDEEQREPIFTKLLEEGALPTVTDETKRTPLHIASAMGELEIVKLLVIEKSQDFISARDANGRTALHLASENGQGEVVEIFLSNKVAPDLRPDGSIGSSLGLALKFFLQSEDVKDQENEAKDTPARKAVRLLTAKATLEEKQAVIRQGVEEPQLDDCVKLLELDQAAAEECKLIWFASRENKHEKVSEQLRFKDPRWSGVGTPSALDLAAHHGKHMVVLWLLKTKRPNPDELQSAIKLAETQLEAVEKRATSRKQELASQLPQSTHRPKTLVSKNKDPRIEHPAGAQDALKQNLSEPDPKEGDSKIDRAAGTKRIPLADTQDASNQDSSEAERRKYNLTLDLLKDPLPVIGLSDASIPYELRELGDDERSVMDKFNATIVDFYTRDGRVDFFRRLRKVSDIIYNQQSGKSQEAFGPNAIMTDARSTLKSVDPVAYGGKSLQMRWIHLPATNMKWLEDLTLRVFLDKKRNRDDYVSSRKFFRGSWHELRYGVHSSEFMQPSCSKRLLPKRSSDETNKGSVEQKNSKTKSKLAEDASQKNEPSGKMENKDANNDLVPTDVIALYIAKMPYINFSTSFQRGGTISEDSEDKENNEGPTTKYQSLIETYKKLAESGDERLAIHGTRSLDLFYYRSKDNLQDQYQVVSRELCGEDIRNMEWFPVLHVDQLWLWVIDHETIITCATHRNDEFDDPVVERIFKQLRDDQKNPNSGRPPPSSARDMALYITQFCINFISTLTWKNSAPSDKKVPTDHGLESIKDIFRGIIREKGKEEHNLVNVFKNKMENKLNDAKARKNKASRPKPSTRGKSEKDQNTTKKKKGKSEYFGSKASSSGLQSSNKKEHIDNKGTSPRYEQEVSDWDAICTAACLLHDVRGIRNELTIFRALVVQQKLAWDGLLSKGLLKTSDTDGPDYILRELDRMCGMTDNIKKSVLDILSLEQSSIGITEAMEASEQSEQSIKQGKTLMVFTIVTIVFTPMSFLTSLFALNTSAFSHDGHGNLFYHSSWIFPMICKFVLICISIAITIPLMLLAIYFEKINPIMANVLPDVKVWPWHSDNPSTVKSSGKKASDQPTSTNHNSIIGGTPTPTNTVDDRKLSSEAILANGALALSNTNKEKPERLSQYISLLLRRHKTAGDPEARVEEGVE